MNGPSRVGPEWLTEHLDRWVDVGIVTAEQARAITSYEGVEPATPAPPQPEQAPSLTLLAEGISYLGISLMAASGALVTARFWKDLHVGGRLAIGLLIVVAGFTAAAFVERIGDEGARRLASFLRLLATGGVALTAGVVAVAMGSHDGGVTALVVGLAVSVTGAALWRNLDRVLPFLSTLTGLVVTVVGVYSVADSNLTTTERAVTVWAASVAVGLLGATGLLRPELAALLVGQIGSLAAALLVVPSHHVAGLILGLATAVAGLFAGMGLEHRSVEAIGVIGCLVFLAYTLGVYVKGPAGAVAILVLGAVLVTLAIRAGLHHKGPPPHREGVPPRPGRRPRPRMP